MTHLQLNKQDEDALFDYINGENDALVLDNPALSNYYYLMGWHDTLAQLARGELTNQMETVNNHSGYAELEDWEVF